MSNLPEVNKKFDFRLTNVLRCNAKSARTRKTQVMDNTQLETFFIIKYGSLELALMHWLTNPTKFTERECVMMEQYSKERFPNLNLIGAKDPVDKPK